MIVHDAVVDGVPTRVTACRLEPRRFAAPRG